MAKLIFANNASTVLAAPLSAIATSFTLAAGGGDDFPNPGADEYFVLTFNDAATGLLNEIVHCTARSGDSFTIVRAREGTTARAWLTGDTVKNLWTAGSADAMIQGDEVQSQPGNYGVDTGTQNALVVTLNPPLTSYPAGLPIRVKVAHDSSGATAATIDAGDGPFPLKAAGGTNPTDDSWKAGGIYEFVSDGTAFIQTGGSTLSVRPATGRSGRVVVSVPSSTVALSEAVPSDYMVSLHVNAIRQMPGRDYTCSGTNVATFTSPLAAGDEVWWVHDVGTITEIGNVTSVNGQQGAVSLSLQALGLGYVVLGQYPSLAAAQADASSNNSAILLTPGTYTVATDTVITSPLIGSWQGVNIVVNSGFTLTLEDSYPVDYAGQIFSGSGSVRGLFFARPEWFGAPQSPSQDWSPFTQKAADSLTRGADRSYTQPLTLAWGAGTYGYLNPVTINLSATRGMRLTGAGVLLDGTKIVRLSGFTGAADQGVLLLEGSSDPVARIAEFEMQDIRFEAGVVGVGTAVTINDNQNNFLLCYDFSKIKDCLFLEFRYDVIMYRARQVLFENCGFWAENVTSGGGARVWVRDSKSGAASNAAGDHVFSRCQFVGSRDNILGMGVRIESRTTDSNVPGVIISECDIYKFWAGVYGAAQNGAFIQDIWVDKCQFDNIKTYGVYFQQLGASSTGHISNLNVTNCYFTAAEGNCVRLEAENLGRINAVLVSDNYSAGVGNAAVDANGVHNLNVNNNRFTGVNWNVFGSAALNISNAVDFTAIGNNFGKAGNNLVGTFSYAVSVTGASDRWVISLNNSAGLATSAPVNVSSTTPGASGINVSNI